MIVLLFFLLWRIPVVQFDFGEERYYLKEKEFTLQWIHSVEKEEWLEFYERDGDSLLLTETKFKTYGAGVPSDGEIISSEDGYVHMKIGRLFTEMNLTVSENAQTTIITAEEEIPLYEYTEDYELVTIKIEFIHLWDYARRNKL
ncbi:hypothetical protein A1A1_03037 [Planococcus antarcticus DSM 14505]|uniref:DUF1850 domain-containing protein n=1 Tax=Planococcus antarcticus DSM 14505 TaxID=1185653 RepID=A0AA87IQV3_9BACL|nr:DUF1850 domain-containing protein [Planococcus antarcticus]EIM08033.1 hypothetical protein A1A1_03037 [Planococcus antarcticus DSM 14505]